MGNTRLHLIGILGGIIWCIGMLFSIIASGQAGFAISYGLGQGATMVAAFWGVFIWKEFHKATRRNESNPEQHVRRIYHRTCTDHRRSRDVSRIVLIGPANGII